MRASAFVLSFGLILGSAGALRAQESTMHAGNLAHALDRLAVTGRVLYVAAHPDDENTRLLAYLANDRHLTVAYLSMTRGGGGQNLIGREQAELLDVLRTEELLSARRIDGAEQRFTRMRDFGYSKSAQETFETWGHDEALADVVWVIRRFQPDVVITRFNEEPPNHGHHTASAVLAREAFAAAADPKRFPEQLALGVTAWQATRLVRNVPNFRNEAPPEGALPLDVGAYDPRLGLSYGELAAKSRSQHQSQGFGVSGERGSLFERFANLAGTPPVADLLDGVPLGWKRFGAAGAPVDEALVAARAALDRDHPERAVPALLAVQRALDTLPGSPRVADGRARIDEVIAAASGVFVRATASSPGLVPGKSATIEVEVVMRRPAGLTLARLEFPGGAPLEVNAALALNERKELAREIAVPADAPISTPYWLAEPSLAGRQVVREPRLVGDAEGPSPFTVVAAFERDGRAIRIAVPVQFSWIDPAQGERLRRVLVVPPATVTPTREAVLLPNGRPVPVVLRLRAGCDAVSGDAILPVPAGWRVEPARMAVVLAKAGDEATVRFLVTPPKGEAPAAIAVRPSIEVAGKSWSYREDVIDYPHVPMQVVLQQAEVRLVPLSVRLPQGLIGYVQGSGDTVPDDLTSLGLRVEVLDDEALRSADLARYHAIVVGIRAYNTREVLKSTHGRLMSYVEAGGTVVVQYNTQSRLGPLEGVIGPYPLQVGRGRVTDERAAMTILVPGHELVTTPNRIGPADFEGWVQERGLYFAETWDPRYTALVSAADVGEAALTGGVLFVRYGRGRYIYTGLSFFRQLPAGVPGAYRLFVNFIGGE